VKGNEEREKGGKKVTQKDQNTADSRHRSEPTTKGNAHIDVQLKSRFSFENKGKGQRNETDKRHELKK
jgi:hypothetical protein